MKHLHSLLLFIAAVLALLLVTACSSPFGPPDPFDQALGSVMAQRAAYFQARAMNAMNEESRNTGGRP